jgi:hypothetical protein
MKDKKVLTIDIVLIEWLKENNFNASALVNNYLKNLKKSTDVDKEQLLALIDRFQK